jgi:hypothetical protein
VPVPAGARIRAISLEQYKGQVPGSRFFIYQQFRDYGLGALELVIFAQVSSSSRNQSLTYPDAVEVNKDSDARMGQNTI